MDGLNGIYPKRGLAFSVDDYPKPVRQLLLDRLRPVDEIVAELPRRFRFFSTFAMSQARGFLRALGKRDDWEDVAYFCALVVEPYAFMRHPKVRITNAYFSPLDRFVAEKMGKTVAHLPRQFIQFGETMKVDGIIDLIVHAATPPDEEGYVNLGVNCEIMVEALEHFARTHRARIIIEINNQVPWVCGHPDYNHNRFHLSKADAIYEHHAPMPQLPPIKATAAEQRIAENVLRFIEDGDTIQLGIGGVPNYIAQHLRERRNLKVHSEMLTDSIVDLVEAGAVDPHGKAYMDGLIVGTFAAGTDKLYDWLDRNRGVALLPIRAVNDPCVIARNQRLKSINSALMIDLHGQVASDAVGYHQISGIGGQLEFVMGAQLSPGGRSVLCLKSASMVGGKLTSNVTVSLPPGTPVTVPRQYADTIVTEHGVAEIKHLDALERAHALVAIAHPKFRDQLAAEADAVGLWRRRQGFDTFAKRAMFNNLAYVRKLMTRIEEHPDERASILLRELKDVIARPDPLARLRAFYRQNCE